MSGSASAYQRKYRRTDEKQKMWRVRVCIALVSVIITVLTLGVGIAAIVAAASALDSDKESDAEFQAARIIEDAYVDWTTPLATRLTVVDAAQSCPVGWGNFFSQLWPGIEEGCWEDDELLTTDEFKSKLTRQKKGVRECNSDRKINAVAPVEQAVFNGKRVCVLRDGPTIRSSPRAVDNG